MDCNICMEPYGHEKTPYVLTCGHSFCFQCLQGLRIYHCPVCDQSFDTHTIRPNFTLLDYIIHSNSNTSNFKNILAATRRLTVEELITLQEATGQSIISEIEKREYGHLCTEITMLQKERNELGFDLSELSTEITQVLPSLLSLSSLSSLSVREVYSG